MVPSSMHNAALDSNDGHKSMTNGGMCSSEIGQTLEPSCDELISQVECVSASDLAADLYMTAE